MKKKSTLEIAKEDLLTSAERCGISPEQAEKLWFNLSTVKKSPEAAGISKLAYYFGAMLVISAMSWFMTLGWQFFGGGGIFLIALFYGIVLFALGYAFWQREQLKLPGGLLAAMAVCMTPLAIYGLEQFTGIWPADNPSDYQKYYNAVEANWVYMELGTIIAGLAALYFVPFPFIIAPIAFSLWFLSLDIVPYIFGTNDQYWDRDSWITMAFGLAMIIASFIIDRRTKEDFAFWGYFFGLLAFSVGLCILTLGHERYMALYCAINVLLMILSVYLGRTVFLVFGAIGVFSYLCYLAYDVFANSILFPFILSFIGLAIVAAGIFYQRHRDKIESALLSLIPAPLQKYLPRNRIKND